MDMKLVNAMVAVRLEIERQLSRRGESVKTKKLVLDFERLKRTSTQEEFNEYVKRIK